MSEVHVFGQPLTTLKTTEGDLVSVYSGHRGAYAIKGVDFGFEFCDNETVQMIEALGGISSNDDDSFAARRAIEELEDLQNDTQNLVDSVKHLIEWATDLADCYKDIDDCEEIDPTDFIQLLECLEGVKFDLHPVERQL